MCKNQIYPSLFFETFQRYCKLVILGTWGLPGYSHQKAFRKFDVYVSAKNQIDPLLPFGDIIL